MLILPSDITIIGTILARLLVFTQIISKGGLMKKLFCTIFFSTIAFISMAHAQENESTNALNIVIGGKQLYSVTHARLRKGSIWVFDASNKIDLAKKCKYQIDVFDGDRLSAAASPDVQNLYPGLVLERTNDGMGGAKNLTLTFTSSDGDSEPFTNGAKLEILDISGNVASVRVTASYYESTGRFVHSISGVIQAIICE
jgi:hypothetical protein